VKRIFMVLLLLAFAGRPTFGQWPNFPTPDSPRTADGKADLFAPAPRTPEGKVDLTGVWAAVSPFRVPIDVPSGAQLTPWAKAIRDERRANESRDIPTAKCLPSGIPPDMTRAAVPIEIIPTRGVTTILFEEFNNWRQIFTDGRPLPSDLQPAWFGYSLGKWEMDVFVVTTAGFNDRTWLDGPGTPHSEDLKLVERFRRPDFGHLEIEYTIDDPKAFMQPFSVTVKFNLLPDTELQDSHCENERDAPHLK